MTAAGEPLQPHHGDELRPLLVAARQSAAPPQGTLSDATFANLLLFRDAHDWRLARGRWPCISGHAYDGARLLPARRNSTPRCVASRKQGKAR